ncbi:MAG: helix-turn-helix transcriptional regulator [Planctomycetia bacterium]|nr:helix-turn-helix transcriptional regulator [Planctomycetia bacterium]
MARHATTSPEPVGELLRRTRVGLNKGLREMAKILGIAPAHLTDLELGRRTPSEELLKRISEAYGIAEPKLRAGWSRPDVIVSEIASQDALTAEKVPALLRNARRLTRDQWDALIEEAQRLSIQKEPRKAK